ncbi:MAG: DUF1553 domain-containing protein, partial [Tepidisphaeraceae bacterium]
FTRRVHLDLIGLLPAPAERDVNRADGRDKLVTQLLANNRHYTEHWLTFWNDLLRNDYKGAGYVDGGRKQITPWLYNALLDNVRYDQFIRELITGANGADGFVKGIVWRGVVNAAQTPQMQAAQNISQVFMGVNLKCASCHDSFINEWKLTDSYGLAGVYADGALEMERCTKPLGEKAPIKFLYPQLGEIDPALPREQRIEKLAEVVLSKDNGRLSRTIVNRMWQRFFGRAFIEPVDEMDNKPWNADLLDALSADFAKHYNLKKLIETMVLSRAYQLPSMPAGEEQKEYVFAGPSIKRLSAEQFADAVSTVTGAALAAKPAATLSDAMLLYKNARWIWTGADAKTEAAPGVVYFRRGINIADAVERARIVIAGDNVARLLVNGKEVAVARGFDAPVALDLKPHLRPGENVLSAIVENLGDKPNPAGLWLHLEVTYASDTEGKRRIIVASDKSWRWSAHTPPAEWTQEKFDGKWEPAIELGNLTAEPWQLAGKLPGNTNTPEQLRASLCFADPLTVALGRPNREQVNTVRAPEATTLQALELTNGETLAGLLGRAAAALAKQKTGADDLISQLYAQALGRAPTATEMTLAHEVIGPDKKADGVEDLLWVVMLLPEFQLIR